MTTTEPAPLPARTDTCACGAVVLAPEVTWVCLCHGDGMRHARTACLDLADVR